MTHNTPNRRAFTLIELLVVIAIIAILASILFPVFSRARENARRTVCLSNLKQINMSLMQYTQDNNEAYPLVSYPTPADSWTISMQPYLKSTQILVCPDDDSTATPRPSSYGFNAWMKAAQTDPHLASYRKLAAVQAPASVICLAELDESSTVDHFPTYCWGASPETPFCPPGAWNATTNQATSIAVTRHFDGFNVAYVDGHAKWVKWTQVWLQKPTATPPILEGNFDPRQSS